MTPDELRIALIHLHKSMTDFADEIDIHRQTIYRYAAGDLEIPKLFALYIQARLAGFNPTKEENL